MISLPSFGKRKVLVPEAILNTHYVGKIYGNHFTDSNVFNIFSEEMINAFAPSEPIGEIFDGEIDDDYPLLAGKWSDAQLQFTYNNKIYDTEIYNLIQNIFSRNTGILESSIMMDKCAFILGCGSVGGLVALELARSGVGTFILVDSDILEYHNLCRHQCSIMDVGAYKVNTLARRIKEINPSATVISLPKIVEEVGRSVFDEYCIPNKAILVGCADNRNADVYANSIAVSYSVPFISVGFWERAFAGEIFYWLPNANMPCYKCALGDGGDLSQRTNTNRRIYTTQEDLEKVNFEPGISTDINFVTTIGIKLMLDILNIGNEHFTPRLLGHLKQYTLVCNTNNPKIGGEMAEIFSYPLQVTTSLQVSFCVNCPPCKFEQRNT